MVKKRTMEEARYRKRLITTFTLLPARAPLRTLQLTSFGQQNGRPRQLNLAKLTCKSRTDLRKAKSASRVGPPGDRKLESGAAGLGKSALDKSGPRKCKSPICSSQVYATANQARFGCLTFAASCRCPLWPFFAARHQLSRKEGKPQRSEVGRARAGPAG